MNLRKLASLVSFALLLAACAAPPEHTGAAQQGLGGAGGTGGASCASSYTTAPANGTLATVFSSPTSARSALVVQAASDCTWGAACSQLLYVSPGSGAYTAPSWIDAPWVDFAGLAAGSCTPAFLPWGSRILGRGQVDGGPGVLPSVQVGDVVIFEKLNQVWHEALVLGVDSSGHFPTMAIPVAGSPTGVGNVVACSATCDGAWSLGFRTQCICAAGLGYAACSGDSAAVCADLWDVAGDHGTARSSWADVGLDGSWTNPAHFPGLRY